MIEKFNLKNYWKLHRYKLLLAFVALLTMSVYIFITTWQSTTYKEVHTMYPLEKSFNKEASEEFLKAMEYRIYIKELHPFLDYDSFIMAPLLEKLDYHFKRGKALLPKDSVEDVVWWVLFYKDIYGLVVPPRNDNSLAYENLPYQEFAKVHDEIYTMIEKYPYGEVYFKIDEIKKFRFQAMAILVEFYYGKFSRRYQGKFDARVDKYNRDDTNWEKLRNLKKYYLKAYEYYIESSNYKNVMQYNFWSDIVYISSELIVKYIFTNNTQKLPSSICYSDEAKYIAGYTERLIDFTENNNNHQSKMIYRALFDSEYSNKPELFKVLMYRCQNINPAMNTITQRLQKLKLHPRG